MGCIFLELPASHQLDLLVAVESVQFRFLFLFDIVSRNRGGGAQHPPSPPREAPLTSQLSHHSIPLMRPLPSPSVIWLNSASVQSIARSTQPMHLSLTVAWTVVPLVGLYSVTLRPQ